MATQKRVPSIVLTIFCAFFGSDWRVWGQSNLPVLILYPPRYISFEHPDLKPNNEVSPFCQASAQVEYQKCFRQRASASNCEDAFQTCERDCGSSLQHMIALITWAENRMVSLNESDDKAELAQLTNDVQNLGRQITDLNAILKQCQTFQTRANEMAQTRARNTQQVVPPAAARTQANRPAASPREATGAAPRSPQAPMTVDQLLDALRPENSRVRCLPACARTSPGS